MSYRENCSEERQSETEQTQLHHYMNVLTSECERGPVPCGVGHSIDTRVPTVIKVHDHVVIICMWNVGLPCYCSAGGF